VDEVIVVVETDKVTVDIKAVSAGRITRLLADDKVTVGGPLYELDHSAASTSTIINSLNQSKTSTSGSLPVVDEHHSHHPLIKFIGKRDKQPRNSSKSPPAVSVVPPLQVPSGKATAPKAAPLFVPLRPHSSAMDFAHLKGGALFGRPELTAREMAAIESGGAD
jgi:pyruvate/2-oxoglutarate dehydrogenase complex dihydrolipoamide acyltransferase (E2) component